MVAELKSGFLSEARLTARKGSKLVTRKHSNSAFKTCQGYAPEKPVLKSGGNNLLFDVLERKSFSFMKVESFMELGPFLI